MSKQLHAKHRPWSGREYIDFVCLFSCRWCNQCNVLLCQDCDTSIHALKILSLHERCQLREYIDGLLTQPPLPRHKRSVTNEDSAGSWGCREHPETLASHVFLCPTGGAPQLLCTPCTNAAAAADAISNVETFPVYLRSREAARDSSTSYLRSALEAGVEIRESLHSTPAKLQTALETAYARIAALGALLVSTVKQRELELYNDAIQMAEDQGKASKEARLCIEQAMARIERTLADLSDADVFTLDNLLESEHSTSSLLEAADLMHFKAPEPMLRFHADAETLDPHKLVVATWGGIMADKPTAGQQDASCNDPPSECAWSTSSDAISAGNVLAAAAAFADPISPICSTCASSTDQSSQPGPMTEERSRHFKRARSRGKDVASGVAKTKRRACGCWKRGPHHSTCGLYQGRRAVVSDPEFLDPLKRRECGCKWRGTHQLTCPKRCSGTGPSVCESGPGIYPAAPVEGGFAPPQDGQRLPVDAAGTTMQPLAPRTLEAGELDALLTVASFKKSS